MNVDSLVLVAVEWNRPEHDERVYSVGHLLEGSQHLLLVNEILERADQYSYIVIPRDLIAKITKLRFSEK